MTREELKEHCKKTVEQCEMWAIHRGEEPSGKVYEEHKAILDILEQEPSRGWEEMTVPCENCGHDMTFKIAVCGEQEPCDDAISRQAVLSKKIYTETEEGWSGYTVDADYIEQLPSAAQKSGKWIAVYQGDEIINYRCSECELGDTNGSTNLYGWDYCRMCGAKMKSEE